MPAFQLFNNFPPEIHSLIFESCSTNDAVCLRLTCKYLYSLAPSKEIVSLNNTEIGNACGCDDIEGSWWSRHMHRGKCHNLSYETMRKRNALSGKDTRELAVCRTRRWEKHCSCYTRTTRLHRRLQKWMPKGLHYCGRCTKFNRRRKDENGRSKPCNHGRRRGAAPQETLWTHRSRKGAFGRQLWKKWFNNSAMNAYEARLRKERERSGTERYSLRKLAPINVDTRIARDNMSYHPKYSTA